MPLPSLSLRKSLVVAAALGTAAALAPALAEAQNRATKQGWWIRIESAPPSGTTLNFFGGESMKHSNLWFTWQAGDPKAFDVPSDWLTYPTLFVRATEQPEGTEVRFCLFYQDAGAEDFFLVDEASGLVKQSDRDEDCVP